MRQRLPLLLVLGATLLASLPLLRAGLPDTHDGLFHVYRLAALDEAIRAGCFYPRWFPDFAFGYGQPVLLFYGPASYYVAELFCLLGAGYLLATKLSLTAAALVAGLGLYGLARRFAHGWMAALAAAAYVLAPYRLADVYVRGAFAEVWGLALIPVLLLLTERAARHRSVRSHVALVVVWSALLLTHNLSALMVAPVWLAYVVWLSWRRPRALAGLGLAALAAVALTAFYWLPILEATPWVGLGNTFSTDAWPRYLVPLAQTVSPSLLYGYFPDQGVAHEYPIGLVAMLALAAAVALLLVTDRRHRRAEGSVWPAVALAAIGWLLQWSASAPLWRHLPLLGFLQFPWRLMGLFWLGWSLLLGMGLESAAEKWPRIRRYSAAVAVATVACLAVAGMARLPTATVAAANGREWQVEMWRHDVAIGQVGATWTAEYVPIWVSVDRSAVPGDPVATDRPPQYALPTGTTVVPESVGYGRTIVRVTAGEPLRLSLHGFYFPGWVATIDGRPVATEPYTDLGLLSVGVPAGEHRVELALSLRPLWRLGAALSALTAAVLVVALAFRPRRVARTRAAGNGVLGYGWPAGAGLAVSTTVWLLLNCQGATQPVNALWASFEERMALTGFSVDRQALRAGQALGLTLHWLAPATPQEDYKVYVHLVAPDGTVVAQSDGDPVGGFTPTQRLVGGELLADERTLVVPLDAAPGQYALYTGMYRWPEVANLRVTAGEQVGAERVLLGTVEVMP
ncbi:MAG: 6-pyruvoyl-tetrahydropterin synthase-related protein [Anaerolineae bacterium]